MNKSIIIMLLCMFCSTLYSQEQKGKYFTYVTNKYGYTKIAPNFEDNPFERPNNKIEARLTPLNIESYFESIYAPMKGLFKTKRIKEIVTNGCKLYISLCMNNQGEPQYISFTYFSCENSSLLTDDELYKICLAYKKKYKGDLNNLKVVETSSGTKSKEFDFYKEGFFLSFDELLKK